MIVALDHLVYAVPDLDAAVDRLDRLLGVRPAAGGHHEGWGTRNALLDLGGATYLEVLGPDPSQPAPAGPRPGGIDDLAEPRLVGWAARTDDLATTVERARAAGHDLGPTRTMTRARPDGVVLRWSLTALPGSGVSALPFLIDWGDSIHPSVDAPKGVLLERLTLQHPDPEGTATRLAAIGLELPVTAGAGPRLVAALRTASGALVELS